MSDFLIHNCLTSIGLLVRQNVGLNDNKSLVRRIVLFPVRPIITSTGPGTNAFSNRPVVPAGRILRFRCRVILSHAVSDTNLRVTIQMFLPLVPLHSLLPNSCTQPRLRVVTAAHENSKEHLLLGLREAKVELVNGGPFALYQFHQVSGRPTIKWFPNKRVFFPGALLYKRKKGTAYRGRKCG